VSNAEAQFIERLKNGESAAFDLLVRERSGEIYGLLYRLTENAEEARDLTQETFYGPFKVSATSEARRTSEPGFTGSRLTRPESLRWWPAGDGCTVSLDAT